MSKQALRTAVGVAVLGILLSLAMPATSHAAAVREDTARAPGDQPASAGLWQSVADLWDGLVGMVFAGSEEDEEDQDNGAGGPPEDGGEDPETDDGPGADPTG